MGLTPPLPSPFEHCQKKLHYWFGRASLKTHTFYLKLSKEKSTGLPFPSCLLWCRDDVLFLNPPFSDNVGSRSRWVLYLRVHFCHIFLLSSLWPLPSHHLREFACAKRRGGRWGVGRCMNVSLFCFLTQCHFNRQHLLEGLFLSNHHLQFPPGLKLPTGVRKDFLLQSSSMCGSWILDYITISTFKCLQWILAKFVKFKHSADLSNLRLNHFNSFHQLFTHTSVLLHISLYFFRYLHIWPYDIV